MNIIIDNNQVARVATISDRYSIPSDSCFISENTIEVIKAKHGLVTLDEVIAFFGFTKGN